MDFNAIIQAVSTIGFPIVMCVVVCFYVKYIMDKNAEQLMQITNSHREESKEMTKAIENNTIAITKLIEKIGD